MSEATFYDSIFVKHVAQTLNSDWWGKKVDSGVQQDQQHTVYLHVCIIHTTLAGVEDRFREDHVIATAGGIGAAPNGQGHGECVHCLRGICVGIDESSRDQTQ